MRHLFVGALVAAIVVSLAPAARAVPMLFTAVLDGASESPSNASPGTGTATVIWDTDADTMRVMADFAGLTGTTTASHIHCCVAAPGNVGVATVTPSFTGFPLGVTSGSYDFTYDMLDAGSYNASFITANGGTVASAHDALLAGLQAGEAYLNIHTSTFPGGEIRGFLTATAVPEPGTLALMVVGLAALRLGRRRVRPVECRKFLH